MTRESLTNWLNLYRPIKSLCFCLGGWTNAKGNIYEYMIMTSVMLNVSSFNDNNNIGQLFDRVSVII